MGAQVPGLFAVASDKPWPRSTGSRAIVVVAISGVWTPYEYTYYTHAWLASFLVEALLPGGYQPLMRFHRTGDCCRFREVADLRSSSNSSSSSVLSFARPEERIQNT